MTAYGAYIESEQFQRVTLPRRAKLLASRLLTTLSVLFSNPDNQAAPPQLWGDTREVHENRKSRLVDIFKTVLGLKATTVTSDFDFEFVVRPPGSPHVDNDMRHKEGTWQHASFSTYKPIMGVPGSMSDALVRTANFGTGKDWTKTRSPLHCSYITSTTNCVGSRAVVEITARQPNPELNLGARKIYGHGHGNTEVTDNRTAHSPETFSSQAVNPTEDNDRSPSCGLNINNSNINYVPSTGRWRCNKCGTTFKFASRCQKHVDNSKSSPSFSVEWLQLTLPKIRACHALFVPPSAKTISHSANTDRKSTLQLKRFGTRQTLERALQA